MVKEVLCMPHSHLDIGYTHPQPMLMEQQVDYVNQVLELMKETEDYPEETRFRWTMEASYVLKKWLETAEKEEIASLKKYVAEGRLCLTALPMHTTPGVNARELVCMLSGKKELEEKLDTKIHIAITHDVDGQPWPLGQVMLDSGVDFYLTGINIHYGGIPFPRPLFFRWEMSDGRKLDTFLGEHYSVFSQVIQSRNPSTEHVHNGLKEQIAWMEENGYDKDYIFLTATNPPQYDNNPPDWKLPELIQQYNEEGHEYKIRLVTAQQLYDKLLQEEQEKHLEVPVYKGDWTDYWNFGCASTARETRVSRLAKDTLAVAEMLECFHLEKNRHYESAKQKCQENIMLYDEHTWGASSSIANPKGAETYAQLVHKWDMAYTAADLSGYLLSRQMEKMAKNPYQSDSLEGLLFVNPTSEEQTFEIRYPEKYRIADRHLSTRRSKSFVPYMESGDEMADSGILTLPPYTAKEMSFDELDRLNEESAKNAHAYKVEENVLDTPYYTVQIHPESGEILQIREKAGGKDVLSQKGYGLFAPVVERIDDTDQECTRETLFGNSVYLRNHNISQWNHQWKAKRTGLELGSWRMEEGDHQVAVVREGRMDGIQTMEQKIIFYTYRPQIRMEAVFDKEAVEEPESLLFAVPLKLQKGWKCHYDTAGENVCLDEEQLGNVCRDYVTVDTAVSMYDTALCITLACPDAPMVQVGDFNFGREQHRIPRQEDPLLLAWPLNNYWSTNFMADQNGRMRFAYELNVRTSYEERQMRADGIRAKQPVKMDALVHVKGEQHQLLQYHGNSAVLGIFPSQKQNGMLVLLKNQSDENDTVILRVPEKNIQTACEVTPQEEIMEELRTADNGVEVKMPPRAWKMIRLNVCQ
ncbi:MAG: hypothetical protein ACLU6W_09210 [Lachnospiraceae bacterium]